MASALTVDLVEFGKFQQMLERRIGNLVKEPAAQALREESEIELTEAKRRTPVLTGALRASGHVVGPTNLSGGNWEVRLVFGGISAPYAIFVHENLEAFHKVGQAKFLESVIAESKPYIMKRVYDRLSRGL